MNDPYDLISRNELYSRCLQIGNRSIKRHHPAPGQARPVAWAGVRWHVGRRCLMPAHVLGDSYRGIGWLYKYGMVAGRMKCRSLLWSCWICRAMASLLLRQRHLIIRTWHMFLPDDGFQLCYDVGVGSGYIVVFVQIGS